MNPVPFLRRLRVVFRHRLVFDSNEIRSGCDRVVPGVLDMSGREYST